MGHSFEIPRELILQYVERRRTDIKSLQKSLLEKSSSEFERIGHQIRGNAISYGFTELEPIAAELEQVAHDKNWERGEQLIRQLNDWISQF